MNDLDGRTALVTGGSRGIGLACGMELARRGATVALCARDPGVLEGAVARIEHEAGGKAHAVAADLSNAAGTQAAAHEATRRLGRVDILVNVAGAAPPGTIDQLTDAQWDLAIDLKLRGYTRLIKALLPGMVDRDFGRIVTVAGNAGKQPEGWLVTSATVNAAVIALTKAVGTSVASSGVTVNAVCPGPTDTDRWAGMQRAFAALHSLSEEQARETLLAAIPAGRIATSDEIAYAVAFFAANRAGHVTGQCLVIDGGQVGGV